MVSRGSGSGNNKGRAVIVKKQWARAYVLAHNGLVVVESGLEV